MNRALLLPALASSLLVGTLTGCDTVRPPSSAKIDQLLPEQYPKLVIEDPGLAKLLAVTPGKVVVDRTPDRPISVSVPIRSLADNTMRVQYRYLWLDEKGREIRRGEWIRDSFAPRIERQLQGSAVDMKSVDWRLEVRSAL